MDESMKSEDIELTSAAEALLEVTAEDEVVIPSDEDTKGPDVSEAEGSDASEAAEASTSEVKESDTAPAESEELTEEVLDEVVEEALPLTVTLTFGEETVEIVVTNNFQLGLRQACQDKGSRYDEFEVDGEVTPLNVRLLLNALK